MQCGIAVQESELFFLLTQHTAEWDGLTSEITTSDTLLPDIRHNCQLVTLHFHFQFDITFTLANFCGGGGFDFFLTNHYRSTYLLESKVALDHAITTMVCACGALSRQNLHPILFIYSWQIYRIHC